MNEPKPFASLTAGLLASKGTARPAMRPQIQPVLRFRNALVRAYEPEEHEAALEDLGWNDMGDTDHAHEAEAATPSSVEAAVPVAVLAEIAPVEVTGAEVTPAEVTPIAHLTPLSSRRSALAHGRRAAFTLRVDAERHLKLRLACTLANRSAQALLIEALDRLLAETPHLESLAEQAGKHR